MGSRSKGTLSSCSSIRSFGNYTEGSRPTPRHSVPETPGLESVLRSQEYPIKFILDESGGKYLIAWEGPFEPSWEPKHLASYAAVRAWELEKQKRHTTAKLYLKQRPKRRCQAQYRETLVCPASEPSLTPNLLSIESERGPHLQSSDYSFSPTTALSGSVYIPDTLNPTTQVSIASLDRVREDSRPQSSSSFTLDSSTTHRSGLRHSIPDSTADTWVLPSTGGSSQLREQPCSGSPPIQSFDSSNIEKAEDSAYISIVGCQQSDIFLASSRNRSGSKNGQLPPGEDQRTIQEVQETPPSQLRINQFPGEHSSKSQEIINPSGPSQDSSQDSAVFYTPLSKSAAVTESCQSTFQFESGIGIQRDSPYRYSFARSVIEESPLAVASLYSSQGQLSSRESNTLRRTASEIILSTGDKVDRRRLSLSFSPQYNRNSSSSAIMRRSAPANQTQQTQEHGEGPSHTTEGSHDSREVKHSWDSNQTPSNQPRVHPQSVAPSSEAVCPPEQANVSDNVLPLNALLEQGHQNIIENKEYLTTPVPFIAPQALHFNVEQATSVTETLESKIQPENAESNASSSQDQPGTQEHEVSLLKLSEMEFAIPLSMDCRVKDDYDKTLEAERRYIERFLEGSLGTTGPADADSLLTRMATMVEKLNNITTHPDINIVDPTPSTSPDATKEAMWAEYSSAKFQFLGYFIDAAKDLDFHLILMTKPGRTNDIVKRYLLGKEFSQHITPVNEVDARLAVFNKEKISFEVRSTAESQEIPFTKPPDLIIAMDSSFDVDHGPTRHLRVRPDFTNLVPVVRLIIANTAEHIKLCLPPTTEVTGLRLLIQQTLACDDMAGELQDDALGVQENAEETLLYLMEDSIVRSWKIPLMEALEIEPLDPLVSDPEITSTNSRQKRWLESGMSDSSNPSKRQRITPIQDISHVSDSIESQTQAAQDIKIPEAPAHLRPVATTAEIGSLHSALAIARAKVKALETSMGSLQYRYEAKHNLLYETRRELQNERDHIKISQARFDRQKDEITRLKDRNAELVIELEVARNTIKVGGGLESDLENSRAEVRALKDATAKLERTVQQERSQIEYTRQQYQNASTSAAQSAMEARQLEEQIQDLEKKANTQVVRLKELKTEEDEKLHLARIQELEALLASREKQLMKKEEELRELKKNRPSTRATSMQPRSPKYGTSRPSSPGSNNNGSSIRGSALKFRAEI